MQPQQSSQAPKPQPQAAHQPQSPQQSQVSQQLYQYQASPVDGRSDKTQRSEENWQESRTPIAYRHVQRDSMQVRLTCFDPSSSAEPKSRYDLDGFGSSVPAVCRELKRLCIRVAKKRVPKVSSQSHA